MTDQHWWTLRNGTTILYVAWGRAYGTVFGTDCQMRKGPPVTIALSLDRNFRTRSTAAGTYRDALTLAEGGLRDLRLIQISDDQIILGLQFLVQHTEDTSSPWHLLIQVRGHEHEFKVEPEFRPSGDEHDLLLLRVVGASRGRAMSRPGTKELRNGQHGVARGTGPDEYGNEAVGRVGLESTTP